MERFNPSNTVFAFMVHESDGEFIRYADALSDKREALERLAEEFEKQSRAADSLGATDALAGKATSAATLRGRAVALSDAVSKIRSELEALDG